MLSRAGRLLPMSFCRFPRTKIRCLSEGTKSILPIVVFRRMGSGDENEKEPVLRPSPSAVPLAAGMALK